MGGFLERLRARGSIVVRRRAGAPDGDAARRAEHRTVIKRIVFIMVAVWLVEVGGRWGYSLGQISAAARDMLGVISMVLLALSFLYVLSQVRQLPKLVHRTILLSVAFLVVFQLSDIADEFDAFQHLPLIGKPQISHTLAETAIAAAGSVLLISGLYYAMLELEWARRRLDTDRARLAENIAVRQKVEQELKEARDKLEAQVLARTAELAERNVQLSVELEERARAEQALAQRLRYEESLAACSRIFQSDSQHGAALVGALENVRDASGARRAQVFEAAMEAGTPVRLRRLAEAPSADDDACARTPLQEPDFTGVLGALCAGRVVEASAQSLMASSETSHLPESGDDRVLVIPVMWEGNLWGVLTLEYSSERGPWSHEEVRQLQTASDMVAASVERWRAAEALHRAHEDLERRVAERTADLTLANSRLQQEIADRHKAELEKEKLEVLLRQAEKMKAIGTLAGGIAHDFNNILSSIIGFTEMALAKTEPEFPYRRYLEEVFKAGNRAKELVRQILVFSRQSEEERVPVDLYEIVDESLTLFAPALPTSIALRTSLDKYCGHVLADPVQMHQVVMNLLANAEHAMREAGGVLEVKLEQTGFRAPVTTPHGILVPGDYVLLTVSDTGHGMAPDTLRRIYEPFFTTKAVGEGTGMGLAIVHGIITSMGGVITVESDYMKGATFRAYLPRYHREVPAEPDASVETSRGEEHILVVDDEPQLVSMWAEVLRGFGYRVSPFTGSPAALAAFESDPARFDLALIDQTMPHMSGADLAQRMLELRPNFPIILATGFSEAVSPEDARAMGIRDYLYKPIVSRDLAASIRKALKPMADPSSGGSGAVTHPEETTA